MIEKQDIENAIRKNWSVDDSDINVSVSGKTITLSGTVNSWYEKDELAVDYYWALVD